MFVGRGNDDDEDDDDDDGDIGEPPALVPFSHRPVVDVVVEFDEGAVASAAALDERFVEGFGGEIIEFVKLSRP